MHRLGLWLWRRHRHHYIVAVSTLSVTVLVFGLVLPGIVLGSLFAELNVREASLWAVWASALSIVGAVVGIWQTRARLRPITAWADGDESDPILAWNAALAVPANLARAVSKTEWVAHCCFSVPAASVLGDLSLFEAMTLGVGSTLLVVVGGVGFGNGLLVLLRPCIDEIAPAVPAGERPKMLGWSLASRLNVGVASILMVLSLGAIAAVLGARATMRDYFVALVVTAGMTLYGVVIFNVGLVRPTVTTVRDLLGVIDRVKRGEFGARVPVAGIDEFGEVAAAFNDMQQAMHERESLRAAFGSYVDPTLASRLLAQDNSIFEGEDVEVTAFFADVRGFTSFADSATAPEAVQLLNRLFEILVPVIHDMGGHANHFLGDGLLAVFGAPNPLVDHADMAVAAAIEIQRQVCREFGGELRIGIGVNTGQVIAGTIGGGGRLEFTVIGDAVNVASRLERLTKETGDAILLTDSTMAALTTCPCRIISRGELDVRGKAKRLRVHAIHNEDLLPRHCIETAALITDVWA